VVSTGDAARPIAPAEDPVVQAAPAGGAAAGDATRPITPIAPAADDGPTRITDGDIPPEGPTAAPSHPGPSGASLPEAIRAAIVAQARREYPNEACGLIVGSAPAGEGGSALRYETARNAAASPYRYEIDPADLLRVSLETDDADEAIWGIVHSHVRSAARPSPTDIGLAFYPDALYLLVSLAEAEADPATGEPGVRAWRIVDGQVFEVELSTWT
jgi:proteasome lid subunit RPN8/RPN11